jgi:hypothetical protein
MAQKKKLKPKAGVEVKQPTKDLLPFISPEDYQVMAGPGASFPTIDADAVIVWFEKTTDGRSLPQVKKALRLSTLIDLLSKP